MQKNPLSDSAAVTASAIKTAKDITAATAFLTGIGVIVFMLAAIVFETPVLFQCILVAVVTGMPFAIEVRIYLKKEEVSSLMVALACLASLGLGIAVMLIKEKEAATWFFMTFAFAIGAIAGILRGAKEAKK